MNRVPTIIQVTQTECGLCSCLAVLRYYGRAETLQSVRADLEAGRDGLGAGLLARFLRSRGMYTRVFRVRDLHGLTRLAGPVILYWEDYHFLVLERFDGQHAVVMDPSVGRRRLTAAELAKGFSGIAVHAQPGPGFVRLRRAPFADWRAVPLLADHTKGRIAAVGALSVTGYAAVLGIPMLTQWAVDRYQRWHGFGDTASLLFVILGAAVAYFAIQLARIVVLSTVVATLGRHLMTHTFTKLLSLPFKYFMVRPPGELLYRLGSVNSVRDVLSSRIAQGVLDVGTLVCVTVYLLVVEWRLGLIAIALFCVNAGYLLRTRTRVLEAIDAELSGLSKSQSAQLDAVVSIGTIKMGGYADEIVRNWSRDYGASLEAMQTRMRLQQGRVNGLTSVVQMFGPLLLLLASLYFVSHGAITIGGAIAVQAVSATYFALSTSVFQMYTELTEASRHLARLADIVQTPSEPPGGQLWTLRSTSIQLHRVSFRYTRHSGDVVRDLSLGIPAGSKVALVGRSGSGKSTLARLLCGLYEPTAGAVRIGGYDLRAYDRRFIRRHIGYIPQEIHLHNRTILDNLTLGQSIPEDVVRWYCEDVGILDFVEDLPMGLRTIVSEMGANFSGGQRQRLAIVRTLLQRPSIIVMDEATASLDTVNERRINEIIDRIGATRVIIAHRLATVRTADYVYVLDQGRLAEHGTHADLMRFGTVYPALYAEDPALTLLGGEHP